MTSNSPCCVQLEKDRQYGWCTCGLSAQQPFCDGAHREKTTLKSLKFVAQEAGEAWLCGCKKTKNPPYCDGSHND